MSELLDRLTGLVWLDGDGPWTSVVLHSRATLARNIPDLRFPGPADETERMEVITRLSQALQPLPALSGATALTAGMLCADERLMLVESGLAASFSDEAPLILSPDGGSLARLHARDHLELVVHRRGLDPLTTLREVMVLERALARSVDFAFDDQFGYLTSDPSVCGPGITLEALVHLPGLMMSSQLSTVLDGLALNGVNCGSFPGFDQDIHGGLLRLKSTAALGRSEREIGRDFTRAVAELVQLEIRSREERLTASRLELVDRVHRSLGILHHARLLGEGEALGHLSFLRLGFQLGLFRDEVPETIDPLIHGILSGHLAVWARVHGEEGEPEALRARFLRRSWP